MKQFFVLVIAATDLILNVDGISAAGASQQDLEYTASRDAEFITNTPNSLLPLSPSGIVSPALISKACLNLLNIPSLIIDLGTHHQTQCPRLILSEGASRDPRNSLAIDFDEVLKLYNEGQSLYQKMIELNFNPDQDQLIIAECVVGGTSTAYSVLNALGYECENLFSSSFPNGNHQIKKQIFKEISLQHHKQLQSSINEPLEAVSLCGDKMQAFVSGVLNSPCKNIILAGGTQMLAVAALSQTQGNYSIHTSPWVHYDNSASFNALHKLCAPHTTIQSAKTQEIEQCSILEEEIKRISNYQLQDIIRAYNQGHVKEGVGMGALLYEVSQFKKPKFH